MEHQVFGRLCPINFRACPLKLLITVRNEVAKVMFLQACVYPHGGGVYISACWDTTPPKADTPRSRHPAGADTLREQTIPREQTAPRETATAADVTHPTAVYSCSYFTFYWRLCAQFFGVPHNFAKGAHPRICRSLCSGGSRIFQTTAPTKSKGR